MLTGSHRWEQCRRGKAVREGCPCSCHMQAVKSNLLSDALKPAKHLDLHSKNVAGVSDSSLPRTSGGDSLGGKHGDGHDHCHRSPGSASLLTQLISDVTRRVVEHTDEVCVVF